MGITEDMVHASNAETCKCSHELGQTIVVTGAWDHTHFWEGMHFQTNICIYYTHFIVFIIIIHHACIEFTDPSSVVVCWTVGSI